MMVRHRVADFVRWKAVFDSHATAQREAGLHVRHVLQDISDPQSVTLLFEVSDLGRARAFVASPAVPGAQELSGVVGTPEIVFLSDASPES
jgi:hypothetical protein